MKRIIFTLLITSFLFSCKKDDQSISLQTSSDAKVQSLSTVRSSCSVCVLAQPVTITGSGFTPLSPITASFARKDFLARTFNFVTQYQAATTDANGNFSFAFDGSQYPSSDWRLQVLQMTSQTGSKESRYLYFTLTNSITESW
jgi:hypothetical protein